MRHPYTFCLYFIYYNRLFNSFTRNNVQVKFGIIGKPTDKLKEFLTKGRSPDHLVSIDDDEKESIFKLFKLLKPAQNLPGKFQPFSELLVN